MVVDKRAKKLAEIVVNYSLSINQKDKLLIRVEDKLKEFAEEIGNTAMEKGAKVIYDLISLDSERKLIERDNIDELKKESKILCGLAKEITASVRVHSKSDPLYLQKVDPNKIVRYEKEALTQFREIIMGDGQKNPGKKWATIAFPTKDYNGCLDWFKGPSKDLI